jgi:rhodanese-related sulfurtransferase
VHAFLARPDLVERLSRLAVGLLAERIASVEGLVIVDVRNPGETALGTIPGALTVGLPTLLHHLDELDPSAPTVVYCAGGYRSAIASSLLRAHGFTDVSDVVGGYTAWIGAEPPADLPLLDVADVAADDSLLRLDVREDVEWEAGHAPGAQHIPLGELTTRISEIDASRRIACICRSGNRSGTATAWLLQQGFDVANVTGGMIAWTQQGLPVEIEAQPAGAVG